MNIQRMILARRIVGGLTVTVLLTNTPAQANFADDWISQKSTTQPSYFKGGQRGYMTGGSFSARWPQSNDHLLSISKPHIKAGCGGIDMFLGGMSFLNVDYLVQKLQRILAAAPAAAFDIALKTLAPQVAATIKELEAIINKLNNLQLDDCKAAKALVGVVADPLSSYMNDGMKAEISSAKSDFMQSSGINDLYKSGQDLYKRAMAPGASTADKDKNKNVTESSFAGCPTVIKDLFGGGSVLANLGVAKGMSSGQIDTFRGYIGDVNVIPSSGTGAEPFALYIPPSDSSTYEGLIDGSSEPVDANGNSYVSGDANKNLNTYVTQRLTSISTKIKSKTAITADDALFLASIPLPVFPALRAAVQTGQETVIIAKLADITSRALAFQMMKDIVVRVMQMNAYAVHAKSAKKSVDDSTTAPSRCNMVFFEQPMQILQKLATEADKKAKEAYEGYTASAADSAAIDSLVSTLTKFNDIVKLEITNRFGAGVANRAGS